MKIICIGWSHIFQVNSLQKFTNKINTNSKKLQVIAIFAKNLVLGTWIFSSEFQAPLLIFGLLSLYNNTFATFLWHGGSNLEYIFAFY
jgi:hypothetical protein